MNRHDSPSLPYKSGSSLRAEHRARHARPESPKSDMENYLDYYQSSLADSDHGHASSIIMPSSTRHSRERATTSFSSSDCSTDSRDTDAASIYATPKAKSRARSGASTDISSDRRRLAIVEMVPPLPASKSSRERLPGNDDTIRSRRGFRSTLEGVAIVAPPDAAPKSYTHLTPPPTAPLSGSSKTDDGQGHHRASSDANVKKSSRDVGIVGTDTQSPVIDVYHLPHASMDSTSLNLPIFQQPHSRSPSPGVVSESTPPVASRPLSPMPSDPEKPFGRLPVTPEIGQEKDIDVPVAAPVVVSLNSVNPLQVVKKPSKLADKPTPASQPAPSRPSPNAFPPTETAAYLHYQPGLHATAGPLPPPPRATFNINSHSPPPPRPPRHHTPLPLSRPLRGDLEAVKQALQLPPSVTAVLASKSPHSSVLDVSSSTDSETDLTLSSSPSSDLHHKRSIHRREGAFSPSTLSSTSTTSTSITSPSEMGIPLSPIPSITLDGKQEQKDTSKPIDTTRTTNLDTTASGLETPAITVVEPECQVVDEDKAEVDKDDLDASHSTTHSDSDWHHVRGDSPSSYQGHTGETPSPPPKSFRNSLTTNLKRFSSLPRTPSLSSRSARRSSNGAHFSSRSPSPILSPRPVPPAKIKSRNPPAMFCHEVASLRSTSERCAVYARKINELYVYDCGLGDWIIETKYHANLARPAIGPPHAFSPQPRHTSRASMISEATFPRRPDASKATDLSLKTRDLAPTVPLVLPYPSLANSPRKQSPRKNSSIASFTPPASIRSLGPATPTSKTGGFFASLGRKTSLSSGKREKGAPASPATPSSSGPKVLTKNPPNITSIPSVPGGPRAPSRAVRSQTLMATVSPHSSTATITETNGFARRPSLVDLTQDRVIDIQPDPEFERQIDKLADLLPHADRNVLAGYLRRAGQDILAIGQYLEDEKNGTTKT